MEWYKIQKIVYSKNRKWLFQEMKTLSDFVLKTSFSKCIQCLNYQRPCLFFWKVIFSGTLFFFCYVMRLLSLKLSIHQFIFLNFLQSVTTTIALLGSLTFLHIFNILHSFVSKHISSNKRAMVKWWIKLICFLNKGYIKQRNAFHSISRCAFGFCFDKCSEQAQEGICIFLYFSTISKITRIFLTLRSERINIFSLFCAMKLKSEVDLFPFSITFQDF